MQAYLLFDLPEDTVEYNLANKAKDLALVIFTLDSELRGKIKYGEKEELQEARDMLYEVCNQYGVDVHELLP